MWYTALVQLLIRSGKHMIREPVMLQVRCRYAEGETQGARLLRRRVNGDFIEGP